MKKLFFSLWSLVITALTLVGGAAAIWFFWPIVLIEPEFSSPQQGEPLQTRLKITNESPIAIYDITYSIEYIEGKPAGVTDDTVDYIDYHECPELHLQWHASFTATINIQLPPPSGNPVIQVRVYYRLPFISQRLTTGSRFQSMRDENGDYHWYPVGDAIEWKAEP
jgi:hypothetical protein